MPSLRRPPLGRLRDASLTRVEYLRREGRGREERAVVAILGMHRSGTSAVAGALQASGLYLGSVLRKHDSNLRGTRENLRIVELHEAILAYSGGSWDAPPARVEWSDEHRRQRDAIVASFDSSALWGFKDPRTVLLLDFWREALGDSLAPVGIFREPGAVVGSLLRRDGGSAGTWFALWLRYNEHLLQEHASLSFPLLEFVPEASLFAEQLAPVASGLGLRPRSGAGFFDARLPGSEPAPDAPAAAVRLYERLRAATV